MAFGMLATCLFALCSASAHGLLALDRYSSKAPPTIADVQQYMNDHASDLQAQAIGCEQLKTIASKDREGPGPWGGQRVATEFLDAGIGEAFAQGALNVYASTSASDLQIESVSSCLIDGITGLTVQNDYDKGLHLFNHGGPHIWEAMIKSVKRHMDSKQGLLSHPSLCSFAGLYGTPQPEEAAVALGEAGGYDLIFEVMQRWYADDQVFQAACCALSDNVNSGTHAAEQIANAGGPLRGVGILAKMIPLTLGRHFQEVNGFGLQYEIVHVINGLLWHDDASHSFRNEFHRLEYLDHLMAVMADDATDNHLQDNCCQAIYYLALGNSTIQHELADAGAIELMATAMKTFAPQKLTGYCTVVHSCATALLTFANASPVWLNQIRQLGVKEALTEDVMLAQSFTNSQTPTYEDFTGISLIKLKKLL